VLAALRRKLVMYESAGMTDRAEYTAYRIAQAEAEPEPAGTIEKDEVMWIDGSTGEPLLQAAGVFLTPAAQQRADELGLTLADFVDQDPTGKAGEFLVSDVVRIYDAKTTPNMTEADIDGD
jgi:pyruvate/2-oxoglutarate dehydrogenase complex dihydrolipoamide acyltransferase (E2) component